MRRIFNFRMAFIVFISSITLPLVSGIGSKVYAQDRPETGHITQEVTVYCALHPFLVQAAGVVPSLKVLS